jgi:hypothetical protein
VQIILDGVSSFHVLSSLHSTVVNQKNDILISVLCLPTVAVFSCVKKGKKVL